MLLGRGIIDLGGFSQRLGVPQQQVMPIQPVQRSIANVTEFSGGKQPSPPLNTIQPVQPVTPMVSSATVQPQQTAPANNPVMTTMPVQQPPQALTQPMSKQLPMNQIQPVNANIGVEMGGQKGRAGMEFISPIRTLPATETY